MSRSATDVALELLRQPGFRKELAECVMLDRQAREQARAAFAASDTFVRMKLVFAGLAASASIDSEEIAYDFDAARQRLGWTFASRADVDSFFDVVANHGVCAADAGAIDKDNPFENRCFVNHGFGVFKMWGQGVFIRIDNRPGMPAIPNTTAGQ